MPSAGDLSAARCRRLSTLQPGDLLADRRRSQGVRGLPNTRLLDLSAMGVLTTMVGRNTGASITYFTPSNLRILLSATMVPTLIR